MLFNSYIAVIPDILATNLSCAHPSSRVLLKEASKYPTSFHIVCYSSLKQDIHAVQFDSHPDTLEKSEGFSSLSLSLSLSHTHTHAHKHTEHGHCTYTSLVLCSPRCVAPFAALRLKLSYLVAGVRSTHGAEEPPTLSYSSLTVFLACVASGMWLAAERSEARLKK